MLLKLQTNNFFWLNILAFYFIVFKPLRPLRIEIKRSKILISSERRKKSRNEDKYQSLLKFLK